MTVDGGGRDPRAVRLNVRTGDLESVPLTDETAYRPVLVEPHAQRPD